MSTEIAIPDPQSRRPESARPMRPGTARRTSLFKQGWRCSSRTVWPS